MNSETSSEIKRLMILLKEVSEERNKFRDKCLASISPTELLTEIQSAYDEGFISGREHARAKGSDGDVQDSWENSLTFKAFLAEHGHKTGE